MKRVSSEQALEQRLGNIGLWAKSCTLFLQDLQAIYVFKWLKNPKKNNISWNMKITQIQISVPTSKVFSK